MCNIVYLSFKSEAVFTRHFEGADVLQQTGVLGLFGQSVWSQSKLILLHSGDPKCSSQTISTVAHRFSCGELSHSRKLHTHNKHTSKIQEKNMKNQISTNWKWCDSWRFWVNMYLWGEMCHPDAANQTEPLAEGLCLVEGQHGLPHLTAVTDRNVGHELHPSCHNRVALACSDQTSSWRQGGRREKTNNGQTKRTKIKYAHPCFLP